MSRKMFVVPYDWVKSLTRQPENIQRSLHESALNRKFNLRFPDDFGRRKRPSNHKFPEDYDDDAGTKIPFPKTFKEASIQADPGHESDESEYFDTENGNDDNLSIIPGAGIASTTGRKIPGTSRPAPTTPSTYKTVPVVVDLPGKFVTQKEELRRLNIIDSDNKLKGSKTRLPRANIDTILSYLSGSTKREPVGAKHIKSRLQAEGVSLSELFGSPMTQSGKGWIKC